MHVLDVSCHCSEWGISRAFAASLPTSCARVALVSYDRAAVRVAPSRLWAALPYSSRPFVCGRMDLNDNVSSLLDQERQTRRDEVAIDLEDRSTKKGTPPIPSEAGDIRDLRGAGAKPTQAG